MRLGRILAVGLLAAASLGVTGLTTGAWAQTDDYPKQPPYAQGQDGPQGQGGSAAGQQQGPGVQNNQGQSNQYPSNQGPGNQDPNNQYPGNQGQGNQDPNGQYPSSQDSGNQYPANQYPANQGPSNQGSGNPNDQGPGGPGGPNAGPNGEQQKSEGPAPNVARLSLIYGDVTTQRGDTGEWSVTTVNSPVMVGDQIATGEQSRTEIQLDYADIMRLAARSQVKIADLSHNRIQVQVAQGYTNFTMQKGSESDVEIDTPNVAVHPLKPGSYRIQVNSDSETDVIVRSGEADITTPEGSTRVKEGELITIRGTDAPEYKISEAPQKDDWDRWNNDRDNVIREADGPRRTNRYYTGAADLDGYGQWNNVPGYGNVWQPYQQANWAPYQAGRWVWQPFYGWTWVSTEPWGWAPYHYGRWFYYGSNWCWWPGPVYAGYRPLWSPAFVSFIGFGVHVGFGFGSIGWFPVGPHDAFYPWYGRGFNHVNVVSITNINVVNRGGGFVAPLAVRGRQPFFSNANLVLTNPRVRASVTSVSAANFGHGVGSTGFRRGVEEGELRESHMMTGNLPVVPTRESLRTGSSTVPAGVHTSNSGHFFTQHQPPAGPESFHDQAARVQHVVGPQAAGMQGGARGGEFHGASTQVDRHDGGGNANAGATRGNESGRGNERIGNTEVPRTGGASNSSAGNASGNGSGNNAGWSHFGYPGARTNSESGRTDSGAPGSRSNDGGRVSRTASPSEAGRSYDRGATQSQNSSPRSQEESGSNWHHYPTPGSNSGTRTNDPQSGRSENGGSKPPLELHHPIVTPRQPDTRNSERNAPPSYSRPSYSQPSQTHSAPPSYSRPSYSQPSQPHNAPRYSPPPSRSSGSSGSSRSAPSGGHSSGGSSKSSGGHSDSKSSGKH